jgi:hypothetical protein
VGPFLLLSSLSRRSPSIQLIDNAQTFAAVISLLNDHRLRNGGRPLGFLNIWLYSFGIGGMNDITSGSNPGCGTKGFYAFPGWDPVSFTRLVSSFFDVGSLWDEQVTGLGTPDAQKLADRMIM